MKQVIPFIGAPEQVDNWIGPLARAMPDERIVPFSPLSNTDLEGCSFAIVANPDPADLAKFPNLRWIQSVWAGVDQLVSNVDPAAVTIVRLVDPHLAAAMGEAVLTWTLHLHRHVPLYASQQRHQIWSARPYVAAQARTVSVMGLGEMGLASIKLLLTLGFKVQGWSRLLKDIPGVKCFAGPEGLQEMLKTTDILVCLLPLTAQTTGLMDAHQLARLPVGASVINFGRGAIFDDIALRSALDSGHLGHAVLDVFNIEPLPAAAWQWLHTKVSVLPHCAATTNTETASIIVGRNILQYRKTGDIPLGVSYTLGY